MHPGPHVIRKQALLWLSYVIVNDRTGEVNVFPQYQNIGTG